MQKAPPRQSPIRIDACNLVASFNIIGDRWSLLILRSALYGVRRFDDFKAELAIPRTVLSDRLKKIVAAGIMVRSDYKSPGSRARPEYVLTAMGEDLRLPFFAMTEWGDVWLGTSPGKPLTLKHKATGSRLRVAIVDEAENVTDLSNVRVHLAAWARENLEPKA